MNKLNYKKIIENYKFVIILIMFIIFYLISNKSNTNKVSYKFNIPFNNVVEGFGEGILDIFKSSDDLDTDIDDLLNEDTATTKVSASDSPNIIHPYTNIQHTTDTIDNGDIANPTISATGEVMKPKSVQLNPVAPLKAGPANLEKPEAQVNLLKNKCKFFNSEKCNTEYPVFTGASLGIDGSSMLCDNTSSNFNEAKVVADIKNNKISNVYVIDSGSGYNNIPIIKIKGGGGHDAKLEAILNNNGSINKVIIINGGDNYTNTPNITILEGKGDSKCFLCCKQ
jgi:hypothetical protein